MPVEEISHTSHNSDLPLLKRNVILYQQIDQSTLLVKTTDKSDQADKGTQMPSFKETHSNKIQVPVP